MIKIPFNQPTTVGREFEYIQDAIARQHLSGDGYYSQQCHAFLEAQVGTPKALLTTSCTDALEMSAILLNLQAGDEVIVPSFTFVSTINAFVLHGATPVFVDIRPDTLNLDETKLADAITPRTKAIVPVHYAGIACEMTAIMDLANQHGIPVIEDNAHALFATYKGKSLGTFGALATQSFHETKNFICGEGGALLINDLELMERAEIIREKGTNRSKFFRGQVDKYTWVDIGSSYLLSDLSAAFLYAQFEQREMIQSKRQHIWDTYMDGLRDWASEHNVRIPTVPDHCEPSYHLFFLVMNSLEERTEFIHYMDEFGINTVFHYQPLHTSTMGQHFGGKMGDHPVAEAAGDQLIRLPFHLQLTDDDLAYTIERIQDFFRLTR